MEKIYMEKNNGKKTRSKIGQILNSQLSNGLTTAMILVAFAAYLAMGFGGTGNVSYAASTTDSQCYDSFQVMVDENSRLNGTIYHVSAGQIIGNGSTMVKMNNNCHEYVYCLDSDKDFPVNGVTYTKSGMGDMGLAYVMKKIEDSEAALRTDFSGGNAHSFGAFAKHWSTQSAIWDYASTSLPNYGNNFFVNNRAKYIETSGIRLGLIGVDSSDLGHTASNKSFYEILSIQNIINTAKNYTGKTTSLNINREDNNIKVTDDEKYYETSKITLGYNSLFEGNDFKGFAIEIKNAPKGIRLVDMDGNVIEEKDYSHLPTTEFKIQVPVNSVTSEEAKKVSILVKGTFDEYNSIIYTTGNSSYQSLVKLVKLPQERQTGLDIDLTYTPDVPDTGMTSAQSIYFVGLVILLCGVGIIYANTKQKQEQ